MANASRNLTHGGKPSSGSSECVGDRYGTAPAEVEPPARATREAVWRDAGLERDAAGRATRVTTSIDAKVKVLRSLRPITPDEAERVTVRLSGHDGVADSVTISGGEQR